MSHTVEHTERDGFPTLCLRSPEGLAATYVPSAGMVCCSLRQGDEELLGQRHGLPAYARSGSTMGIPLLHPWANRLGRRGYRTAGVDVAFPSGAPLVHDDGNGLPIHGLLGGFSHWEVLEAEADGTGARLVAEADLAARPEVMALFPFPHVLLIQVRLRESTLRVDTTVRATGDVPVPIAFGYHPYFRLPDVPRSDWEDEIPVRRRAILDERCLPTGKSEPVRIEAGPLGERTVDNLFVELEADPVFALAGGGRRIEVAFDAAYRVGVVYAPPDDDVICFEPMTAPTNPFESDWDLASARPGESFSAGFAITVSRTT